MAQALLTLPTVARQLGVSESCTRRLIQAKLLPSVRVGHQIRVSEEQLRRWIDAGGAGWAQAQPVADEALKT